MPRVEENKNEHRQNGPLEKVVILGVGTMAPGLAVDYLLAGNEVTLLGRKKEKITSAKEKTIQALSFLFSKGIIEEEKLKAAKILLKTAKLEEDFRKVPVLARATLVVESVSENVGIKQELLKKLEEVVAPSTLILSNTSGLSISEIGEALAFPGRFLGTHYWNPAYLMPLVEVTPGKETRPEFVTKVCNMLEKMGKTPVLVKKEKPGLIWNRLQLALLRECLHLLEEGIASVEDLDLVVEKGLARRWSFIGPFKTSDLGGQDVFLTIGSYLFPDLANNPEPPAFWQEMVDRGQTGLKAGKGFYNWSEEAGEELLKGRDEYLLKLLYPGIKPGP